jgi:hypothetical protein
LQDICKGGAKTDGAAEIDFHRFVLSCGIDFATGLVGEGSVGNENDVQHGRGGEGFAEQDVVRLRVQSVERGKDLHSGGPADAEIGGDVFEAFGIARGEKQGCVFSGEEAGGLFSHGRGGPNEKNSSVHATVLSVLGWNVNTVGPDLLDGH